MKHFTRIFQVVSSDLISTPHSYPHRYRASSRSTQFRTPLPEGDSSRHFSICMDRVGDTWFELQMPALPIVYLSAGSPTAGKGSHRRSNCGRKRRISPGSLLAQSQRTGLQTTQALAQFARRGWVGERSILVDVMSSRTLAAPCSSRASNRIVADSQSAQIGIARPSCTLLESPNDRSVS